MSRFRQCAAEVRDTVGSQIPTISVVAPKPSSARSSRLASVSREVLDTLGIYKQAKGQERDSEWQRVNSSVADVLKDSGVLFSKLARLQGDFAGKEREELEDIGNVVRSVTDRLSKFSSEFYAGELEMRQPETPFSYGEAPPAPDMGPPTPTTSSPPRPDEDFDVEAEISDEDSNLNQEFDESE